MGVDNGWEKLFLSLHYAIASTEPLQRRYSELW
jgi:hypothetical protein